MSNPYPEGPIKELSRLFGRKQDIAVLRSHIISRRWTVITGRSGAGKSSLLAAGIQDGMNKRETRHRIVILREWRPREMLFQTLGAALPLSGKHTPVAVEQHIKTYFTEGRKLLLLLDQFEQYLRSTDPVVRESDEFLAKLVHSPDLNVHVCAAIREDELFRLSRLKSSSLNPLDNVLFLQDLNPKSAREVIYGPLKIVDHPCRPTDADVEKLIASSDSCATINAALLTIFCRRWWDLRSEGERDLFEEKFPLIEGLNDYCHSALESAFPRGGFQELDVAKMLFSLTQTDPHRLTVRQLEDTVENMDGPSISNALAPLDGCLLDHIREATKSPGHEEFQIVHDLFVAPIAAWASKRLKQGSHPDDHKPENLKQARLEISYLRDVMLRLRDLTLRITLVDRAELAAELLELWPRINGDDRLSDILARWLCACLIASSQKKIVRVPPCLHNSMFSLVNYGDRVEIWDKGLERRNTTIRPGTPVSACEFSRDENEAYVITRDLMGLIGLWDLNGNLLFEARGDAPMFAALLMTRRQMLTEIAMGLDTPLADPAVRNTLTDISRPLDMAELVRT